MLLRINKNYREFKYFKFTTSNCFHVRNATLILFHQEISML